MQHAPMGRGATWGGVQARGRFNCESYDMAMKKPEPTPEADASEHVKPGMAAPVGIGADTSEGDVADDDSAADLDEFSKAAIASLSTRDTKKRQEAAQKKKTS